ncbi:hypothetical protein TCSYLVIO_006580, partial [Trypanosoma cruzi]
MDFGLANDPTQATRITHRNASSPDVAAYCALRISHWTFAPLHGFGPLLNILLGRDGRWHSTTSKHAALTEESHLALRKSDWPALHRCVEP